MSERSKIAWCDHTFNPWWGCRQISPGCDHCYAKALAERFRPRCKIWNTKDRLTFGMQHWDEPLRWNQRAWARGRSESVFVGSMCDVFDPDGPKDQREGLWNLIAETPYLDWLLLTKRPDSPVAFDWPLNWVNVRVGVTVENGAYIDRIGELLRIPARSYFVSFEPLLGPVDPRLCPAPDDVLACKRGADEDSPVGCMECDSGRHWVNVTRCDHRNCLDWVIVGGESGPGARPIAANWVRAIRDACVVAQIPFFFKQWTRRSGPRSLLPVLDRKTWHQKPPARTWKPQKTRPLSSGQAL